MNKPGRTFAESWHKVANLKVCLKPATRVRMQYFRGEKWFVVSDPYSNQFYRMRPEAWEFVSRLDKDRTVEEVWRECLDRAPDEAPGQEDVIGILTQLHFANLLYFSTPADSGRIFERYQKRRQREIRGTLLSIMFFRLPLWDPELFLRRILPVIRVLISPVGAAVWTVLVVMAVKAVVENFDQALSSADGVLAPGNLFWLYLALVVVKSIHELGHAMMCKRFGGEVHTMGVMLLVFTPLPYMDATSSWAFRSRVKRALVGGAGMIFEIFVAAIATLVWARTGPGPAHAVAYNIMFIASVSTVLFNANPLLRFDGYYILSDLLDIPNLHTRAKGHLRHLVERYAFGYKDSASPTQSRKEAFWLTVFGILSWIYRVLVFTGIILFVADKWLIAGLVMAAFCIFSWVLVPMYRFVAYLGSSPRLARTRLRAIAVSLVFIATVAVVLGAIPFPDRFRVPGLLESEGYLKVAAGSGGRVAEVLAKSGEAVEAGRALLRLEDPELLLQIDSTRAQITETLAMRQRAMSLDAADLAPIGKRLETVRARLDDLLRRKEDLVIRAREDGIWVSPGVREMVGVWVPRGATVGEIVNPVEFRFAAVVDQDEASNLFTGAIDKAEVRIFGQGGKNIEVGDVRIIPYRHERLPSAALGWRGGGEVAVSLQDEEGTHAAEPFFAIYADLAPRPDVAFLHGRSGKLRFSMGRKPLLIQWTRSLLQLLQKRYRI